MSSLFEKETADGFISRINALSPSSQPVWGKMDVSQMLHHCQKAFMIASGDLIPRVNPVVRFLFGKSARNQVLRDPQFKRNLPTFPGGKVADAKRFGEEKDKLITLVKNYQQRGEQGLTREPHPFFGKMSPADWDTLEVKHLDHHLRQFGV